MSGYTKLFASIVDSTIWRESKETKIVWITMLAKSDKHGIVEASVPGLADASRVSVEECRVALSSLASPDPDSRTKDHAGRRIKEIEGGWLLLNHGKYRARLNADDRREYQRQWMAEKRAEDKRRSLEKNKDRCGHDVDNVDNVERKSPKLTHTEAEAEAEAEAESTRGLITPPLTPKVNKPAAPSREEVRLLCEKSGLPASEEDKFWNHYMSNGWMVGRNRMRSLRHAVGSWCARWREAQSRLPRGMTKPKTPGQKAQERRMAELQKIIDDK